MFERSIFAISLKSIHQMIVCSRIVARHNYQSLSTNERVIPTFDVRSSCAEPLGTMWQNLFHSKCNRLIELQQVNYLHAISETCRKHAETRLSSTMLCLEQKSVTEGETLLVQLDFTGNNNHPSVIIGLGKRTLPVLQEDALSIVELQHFLETVFTLHTNRGSDCDLEDLLDEAAYANGLKFSMIFFGLSARIGAEHPKSIGATTAFQEVFFKELNTDKFSVFPQVRVRYGIGVGSVWKRHDLAMFALPKADVIASCGISGKLDSKKSHLVTVIEILSRSNPSKDTMDNVHLLEKHQIPVYYIVDLNEKRVDEYLFNNNTRKFNAKKTFERSSQDSFIVEPTGVRFFFSDFEGVRRSC